MWPHRVATAAAEAGPESPPAATARAALAALLAEINATNAKLVRVGEIESQRLEAEAEEAAAGEAFDAVADAERSDIEVWTRNGCLGVPPTPRAEQRVTAQQRVAGAKVRAEAARHTAGAVAQHLAAANAALAQLEAQRRPLVGAVLVECAREIAARYSRAVAAAVKHEIVLAALRRQLADLGAVEAGMAVAMLMRQGEGQNPTLSKAAADALRREIAAFVQRLAQDAGATFPKDKYGVCDDEE